MLHRMKKGLLALSRVKGVLQVVNKDGSHIARNNISTAASASTDQSSRYYTAQVQELFKDGRYEAIRQLGTGRYSHVWLAKDLQQNSYVALKLLTSDCYGQGHDIFEIEILAKITQEQKRQQQQRSTADTSHVIGLLDSFKLHGPAGEHRCIVMPVLGTNLRRQAQRFPDRRIPVKVTKVIVRQLLTALAFLHDDCKVIHTDLQPANICVEIGQSEVKRMASGESTDSVISTIDETARIRIIDFGVASWIDKHLSDHIQPEHLRAPEVVLGALWGPPVDIWSLGCLVIEFIKGHVVFPGQASAHGSWTSEDDHLAQYMEVLGPIPHNLLKRGAHTSEYFNDKGMGKEEVTAFIAFLRGALALDPQSRSTATQLLQHEWLCFLSKHSTGERLACRVS